MHYKYFISILVYYYLIHLIQINFNSIPIWISEKICAIIFNYLHNLYISITLTVS